MKKNTQTRNYKLAMTGIFGALSVLLSITPLGYIQIGPLAITVMHIPVILATVIAGLFSGLGVAFIFGLTSLIRAAITGGGNFFFLNPCVSILPRLLIPVTTYLTVKLLSLIPHFPKTVSGAVAAAIGTLTNTVFVMLAIYVFYAEKILASYAQALTERGFSDFSGIKGYLAILTVALLTNGIWEILAAVIITGALLASIYAAQKGRAKLRKIEEKK